MSRKFKIFAAYKLLQIKISILAVKHFNNYRDSVTFSLIVTTGLLEQKFKPK